METPKTSEPTFLLLALESIKYILQKNIEQKKQKEQIIELGSHLGDKISNHLMNSQNLAQGTPVVSQINSIFNFLSDEIWPFIFDKKASIRKEKLSYLLETTNIKLHSYLITDKSSSNDEKIDPSLWFVEGIIKGVISSFNVGCDVSSSFKRGNMFDNQGSSINPFEVQYNYTFEITPLDYN